MSGSSRACHPEAGLIEFAGFFAVPPENVLRLDMIGFGGGPVVLERRGLIFFHPFAEPIEPGQLEGRIRVGLVGAQPDQRGIKIAGRERTFHISRDIGLGPGTLQRTAEQRRKQCKKQ